MIFYLIAISTWLSSCQKNEPLQGLQNRQRMVSAQILEQNTCANEVQSLAVQDPATQNIQDIRSTYFAKKIDYSKLKTVLNLSTDQTIQWIRSQNIDIFKIPSRNRRPASVNIQNCDLFKNIDYASAALQEKWEAMDPSGLKNVGLYIPHWKASRNAKNKSVILVSELTDRWTLVHEYVHALFDRQQNQKHSHDQDLVLRFERSYAQFQKYDIQYLSTPISNEEKLKQVQLWIQTATDFSNLLTSFTLEEIAVESILREAYVRQQFLNVTKSSFDLAGQYIQTSILKAKTQMGYRLAEADRTLAVLELLQKNSYFVQKEYVKTLRLKAKFKSWDQQISQIENSLRSN